MHSDGTNWAAVKTPKPAAHGGSLQSNALYGISCSSAQSCLAVGVYSSYTANGSARYYDETLVWNGRAWSAANANSPGVQHKFGVACVTSTDCWGVGSTPDTLTEGDFAQHWNGRSWTSVRLPVERGQELPQTLAAIGPFGVTCTASDDCWTVGSSARSRTEAQYGTVRNQALHWDGSSWKSVSVPDPQGAIEAPGPAPRQTFLSGVSCTASTNCWAVGHYSTYHHSEVEHFHAEIVHWDGKAWTQVYG